MTISVLQLAKDVLNETRHGHVPDVTVDALAQEVVRLHTLFSWLGSYTTASATFVGPFSSSNEDPEDDSDGTLVFARAFDGNDPGACLAVKRSGSSVVEVIESAMVEITRGEGDL